MKFSAEIFRQYDIRGITGTDLTDDLAYHLGRAVGTWVMRGGGSKVVVGRDCRPSGEPFAEAFARGLRERYR